jgi:hypothetical protein
MSVPARRISPFLVAQVFADRDIFHFLRDDALPRIPELTDRVSSGGTEGGAPQTGKNFQLSAAPVTHGALDMDFA